MTEQHWRAMATAPRDATPIIALAQDGNSVDLVIWDRPASPDWPRAKRWFYYDGREVGSDYAPLGWIPFPDKSPSWVRGAE